MISFSSSFVVSLLTTLLFVAFSSSPSTFFINAQTCNAGAVSCSCANLSLTTINMLLTKHNNARRAVANPFPQSMPSLSWDDRLAHHAEAYLRTCTPPLQHSSQAARTNVPGLPWNYVGENLGSSSQIMTESDFAIFVDLWIGERDYWTHVASPCTAATSHQGTCGLCSVNPANGFAMCGHYTQVIWSETKAIGCAWYAGCPDGATRYSCEYGIGGNWAGESVYKADFSATAAAPPCSTATPAVVGVVNAAGYCAGAKSTGSCGTSNNNGNPNGGTGSTPSTGGSSPTGNSSSGDSSGNGGLIAGVVVGVIALIGAVAVALFFLKRKRDADSTLDGVAQNYLVQSNATGAEQNEFHQNKGDEALLLGLRDNNIV